jgi:hypothetical protein
MAPRGNAIYQAQAGDLIEVILFQATFTKNVIPKILSDRKPDLSLGLGLLLATDPETKSKTALKIMMAAQV